MLTELMVKAFVRNHENVKDKDVRQAYGYLGGFVGIAANGVLFAVKLAVGLLSNSIAITADAFNNLSDAASSIITLVGFKITNKPADREHPFGHGRIEYISALVVSFMVILVGFEFLKSSYDRIRNPEELKFDLMVFGILLLSIGIKVWISRFYKRIGGLIGSHTMEATAVDSLSDVISTSVVAFSLLTSRWIAFPIDGYIGLAVAAFIIYNGISLTKETLNPLLGEAPEPELTREIIEKTLAFGGVIGVHDIIVHNYGPGRCVVSLHAEIPGNMDIMEAHDLIDAAEKEISDAMNIHLVMHMDPINTDDKLVQQTQQEVIEIIRDFHAELSIHDFRVVGNEHHKNVIFDMVIPHEYDEKKGKMLCAEVTQAIKEEYPHYDAVINIDREYSIIR